MPPTSPHLLSDAASDRPSPSQPTQARITKACASCSRQKLRCDGAKPCGRCVSLGVEAECAFLPSMRGKTRKKRITSEASGDASVRLDDPHRQMWEKSRRLSTAGASNAKLWRAVSDHGVSLGRHTPGHSRASVDKVTSTLPLPGDGHNPLALLVELSDVRPPDVTDSRDEEYYAPIARTLKDEAPHIMSLITPHEAEQLFETFFTHLHPHLPILDRRSAAPGQIARRNNFLFNAICCVAARCFNVVLWGRLKEFARFEMERLPKEKNIDVVQGHLIYTWWKRFEQDMTWLRSGLAMRTAVDISLHRVGLLPAARQGLPADVLDAIIRTWVMCFVIDRTLCIQLGKSTGRQWDDEVPQYIGYLRGQGRSSPDNLVAAALAEWVIILSHGIDAFRLQELRVSAIVDSHGAVSDLPLVHARQLSRWRTEVEDALRPHSHDRQELQFPLFEAYGRLVIQSLALQQAIVSNHNLAFSLIEYQTCAIDLLQTFEQTAQGIRAQRGLPDFTHAALTYAATSLLRCTQSRFSQLGPDSGRIFPLARKAADMLAEAATGPDHIAAIQSAFISRLVAVRETAAGTSPTDPLFAGAAYNTQTSQGLDFEAFARALTSDQGMTTWPPTLAGGAGDPATRSGADVGHLDQFSLQSQSMGLEAWLSQQDFGLTGSALGPGVGDFLGANMTLGDFDALR